MQRGFQLLGLLTLLPWLLGAECSPPAPCGGDADGDGLLDCAPEEHAACLSLCVVLGQEGDPCVVDPCSVGPAGTVCATGYTCVAGQCEPANDLLWQACDPSIVLGDPSYCSSGTYCGDLQNCEDLDAPPWLDASALGVCLLPAREGERCMGNYADLESGPVCSPCSPGLECAPAPWNGAIDVCQRGCTTDDDCPCDVVAQGDACTDGHCRICTRSGFRCEEGGAECCDLDPDTQCRSVSFFDPQSETYWRTDNFCCRPQGSTCAQDADCCPNARCNGGTCEGCGSFPGAPPGDAGCCPGLVLRTAPGADPVCGLPCPNAQAGRTCRYADTLCGADQPWTCDRVLGDYCPSAEESMEGAACVNTEWTDWCELTVMGQYQCSGGTLECQYDSWELCLSPDTPAHCGGGSYTDACQIPFWTYECNANSECAPGYFCSTVSSGGEVVASGCLACENLPPRCWRPTQRGGGCLDYPEPHACP